MVCKDFLPLFRLSILSVGYFFCYAEAFSFKSYLSTFVFVGCTFEAFFVVFEMKSSSVTRLECSGLIRLTATSAYRVQAVLLPQPLK